MSQGQQDGNSLEKKNWRSSQKKANRGALKTQEALKTPAHHLKNQRGEILPNSFLSIFLQLLQVRVQKQTGAET